ncbi:MAG: class I SAM-dependent methyltransferase [Candidatus Stahlbacteria bacterium]|nr:class I SAM-dependent methyltransferase [Candidatus Stahlbacteria bacterium]
MVKYLVVAGILKLFSSCSMMKNLYRFLGNTMGAKLRSKEGLPVSYMKRVCEFLPLLRKYVSNSEGARFLEIGTGWIHWESIFIRLFYPTNIVLFDICDNRQLGALKQYFTEFSNLIDKNIAMSPSESANVHLLLNSILSVNSFAELYHLLGFQYVVEPSGRLCHFEEGSFDVLFSCNCLEHIDKNILTEYIQSFYRLLKPGGYSIHTIDIGDHLSYYAKQVSFKNYLKYSDTIWRRHFENKVQYFNRLQKPYWLNLFQEAGLELVEAESLSCNIRSLKIDKKYAPLSKSDLECITLKVVHRKPNPSRHPDPVSVSGRGGTGRE